MPVKKTHLRETLIELYVAIAQYHHLAWEVLVAKREDRTVGRTSSDTMYKQSAGTVDGRPYGPKLLIVRTRVVIDVDLFEQAEANILVETMNVLVGALPVRFVVQSRDQVQVPLSLAAK